MKKILIVASVLVAGSALAHSDAFFFNILRANRRANSKIVKSTVADTNAGQTLAVQAKNGDEVRYADKRASFGKSIKQLDSGLIDPAAFKQLVISLNTGDPAEFNKIPMGTSPVERRLVSPQAALGFNLIGADSWINVMPAAPELTSAETAGEMVEVYWHALTRDVSFNNYGTDGTVASAVTDLNKLSDFKGPKVSGAVTTGTLFRGNTPGDLVGPFISQFLYQPIPYGPGPNYDGSGTLDPAYQTQVVPTTSTVNNFMTSVAVWKTIQTGANPTATIDFDTTQRLFIRNERDLADYVHQDTPEQVYVNAGAILLGYGDAAIDPANPFLNNPTQEAFVSDGTPAIICLVSVAAEIALQTAWYQKWMVHRRARPEFVGFLANQQKSGATDFGLNSELIDSAALPLILALNGGSTYLLPQAYPEGSPTHPSYPAGHAVVAGACATILKAFFNESFVIPSPVMPSADNMSIVAYTGTALTVGNELNKLASNIALGRDMAGVHYRSDGTQGILLGEKVAIALLEDESFTRNMPFKGFSLTKFDGSTVTVGTKKTVAMLG